jgi:hypothetical protein
MMRLRPRLVIVLAAGSLIFGQRAGAGVIVATASPVSAVTGVNFSGTVATFTDSDTSLTAGDYTASINWGDLSISAGTVSGASGSFTVTGSHTYVTGGSFIVMVTITAPNSFVTQLVGSQVFPPNASPGIGSGTVVLNGAQTQITVNENFLLLMGGATAAHVHGPAAPGVNAPVLFPFASVPNATAGTVPQQSFAITAPQVAQLQAALFYMDVHSSSFPGGEIRGQLNVETTTAQGTADVTSPVVPTLGGIGLLTLIVLIAAAGVLVLGRWNP